MIVFQIINGWYRYLFTKLTEEEEKRISICNGCNLRNGIKCGDCGCYLMAKVKCSICKCPVDKW